MPQIKFFQIDESRQSFFRQFDPYDFLFDLKLSGGFALGAGVTSEDDGVYTPAGLMVAGADEDSIVVKWLYVAPEYRGLYIGTRLMELAFEEAHAEKLNEVVVRVSGEYRDNDLGWDPQRFFIDLGFDGVEKGLDEWSIPSAVLYGSDDSYKHIDKGIKLMPFSEINKSDLEKMYVIMADEYKNQLIYGIETIKALADPLLSYAWVINRELVGGVVNARSDNYVFPIAFFVKDPKDSLDLASAAIEISQDCVEQNDVLMVRCENSVDEMVMAELLTKASPKKVRYFTKNVDAFMAEKEDASWITM